MDLLEFDAQALARTADDTAGSLAGSKLGLCKVAVDINQDTVLATFTAGKATFTSYIKTALVWGDPSIADDGTIESVAEPITFRPTDALGGDQVMFCAWIEDTTAAILQFAGAFDVPHPPMNGPLDVLIVVVRYRPQTQTVIISVT